MCKLGGIEVVREQTKTRHSFVTVGRAAGVSVNADQLRAVSPATAIRDSTCPGDLDSVVGTPSALNEANNCERV